MNDEAHVNLSSHVVKLELEFLCEHAEKGVLASMLQSCHALSMTTDEAGSHPAIDIRLEPDEAVVLFELLSRWSASEPPSTPPSSCFVSTAEGAALNAVLALLEKQLAAPFRADYLEILEHARKRIAANWDYPTLSG